MKDQKPTRVEIKDTITQLTKTIPSKEMLPYYGNCLACLEDAIHHYDTYSAQEIRNFVLSAESVMSE